MKPRRTLPPTGAPIYVRDLVLGVLGIMRPAYSLRKFQTELKSYFQAEHVFLVSSGKAALTLILQALAEMTGKDEVVIPSYTCFSVPSSVVKAGLKPIICDISENDTNYDLARLKEVVGEKTVCVIATHLFGVPCDLEPVLSVARSAGCYVIEDCAQAMGAEVDGKKVGTIGDVGFFSLGRGKNISAVSGGMILTSNDRIARALEEKICSLRAPGLLEQFVLLSVAVFLYLFSRPYLYWLPAGLPFLKIGQTIYSTGFRIEKLAGFNAGLAADWKTKLNKFNDIRRKNAETYRSVLKDTAFTMVRERHGSSPVYLRFPIFLESVASREAIVKNTSSARLGMSPNYPSGIAEIPELKVSEQWKAKCRRGNDLARRLLTVPTHREVTRSDIEVIAALIHEETGYPICELASAREIA